jgi:hypothetical protein
MPISLLGATSGYTQIVAAAVAGNNTLTLPTTTGNLLTDNGSGSLSLSGSLNFTSTGNRITGDMTNATLANRVMFQNSITNSNSNVSVIPNGTSTVASFRAYGASDPTNAPSVSLAAIGTTETRINSEINGTASYTPMTFYTGGSERMRIDTSGNVGIGTSSPGVKLEISSSSQNIVKSTSSTSYAAFQRSAPTGQQVYDFYTVNGVEVARITSDGSNILAFATGSSATERMRIDSSGNVSVGVVSATEKLTVGDGFVSSRMSTGNMARFNLVNTNRSWSISNYGTQYSPNGAFVIADETAAAVRITIDTSGNLQVGGTTVANTVGYVNSRTNTRAWARWNGANGTITSSYNVSSVTRSSAGQYVVNFTTALADANYAPMLSCAGDTTVYNGYGVFAGMTSAPTTSSFAIWTKSYNGTATDPASVQVAVFGN